MLPAPKPVSYLTVDTLSATDRAHAALLRTIN